MFSILLVALFFFPFSLNYHTFRKCGRKICITWLQKQNIFLQNVCVFLFFFLKALNDLLHMTTRDLRLGPLALLEALEKCCSCRSHQECHSWKYVESTTRSWDFLHELCYMVLTTSTGFEIFKAVHVLVWEYS